MRHAECGNNLAFFGIRHRVVVISQQMPDGMAEPSEQGQDGCERGKLPVDHIAEMQREGEFFLHEVRGRRLEFRD